MRREGVNFLVFVTKNILIPTRRNLRDFSFPMEKYCIFYIFFVKIFTICKKNPIFSKLATVISILMSGNKQEKNVSIFAEHSKSLSIIQIPTLS